MWIAIASQIARSKEDEQKLTSCDAWSENMLGERARGLSLFFTGGDPQPGRRRRENPSWVEGETCSLEEVTTLAVCTEYFSREVYRCTCMFEKPGWLSRWISLAVCVQ